MTVHRKQEPWSTPHLHRDILKTRLCPVQLYESRLFGIDITSICICICICHTVPSRFLHCSFTVPSLFRHCSFTVPSRFLHVSFTFPLLFLHFSSLFLPVINTGRRTSQQIPNVSIQFRNHFGLRLAPVL